MKRRLTRFKLLLAVLVVGVLAFEFAALNWWWIAHPKPPTDDVLARIAATLPRESATLARNERRRTGPTSLTATYTLAGNRRVTISIIGGDNASCFAMDPEGLKRFQTERQIDGLIGFRSFERIRNRSANRISSRIRAWHSLCYQKGRHLALEVSGEGDIEDIRSILALVDLDLLDSLAPDLERLHRRRSWPASLFPD